jgi:hypothetical protein
MSMIEHLLLKLNRKQIWDTEPVFCFTSDIDWASEDVLKQFFKVVNPLAIDPTLFLTNNSEQIEKNLDKLHVGIHPNFLPNSSHGNSFVEVINCVKAFSPDSIATRSHRAFEVTDTSHLQFKNGYRYSSNCITIMQPNIRPVLLESGLINFPVFFEDGTHLYNELDLNFQKYIDNFRSPGLKIISFHPMNFILNSPSYIYMRQLKDKLTREQYASLSDNDIEAYANKGIGIRDTILDIISYVKQNNFKIFSLKSIYLRII